MYFNRDTFPKAWFATPVKGVFEGIEVAIPNNTQAYLTRIYGDYMKLPPLKNQVGKHHNSGVSTTVSYRDFDKI